MADSVKDRLILFIEYKGISKNAFEKACGLSTRYVSNMRQSIQPDKIKKIALAFPELNTGWLLTGEGEMIKGEVNQSEDNVLPQTSAINEAFVPQDDALVAELRAQIERLESKVDNLNQELGEKNALIKLLRQGAVESV
jgi:transcriptional regulator with XRE-family HTH domain